MALTGLTATVDREEYSRFERGRDVITVLITPTGTGLAATALTLQLIKARRNRDVVIAEKTVTLVNDAPATTTLALRDIVDTTGIPLARRGNYFVQVANVPPAIIAVTADFLINPITVDKMRRSFLHGTDQRSVDLLLVYKQPTQIPIEVISVSSGHLKTWGTLSYTGPIGKPRSTGLVNAGATVLVLPWDGDPLVASAEIGHWVSVGGTYRIVAGNTTVSITVTSSLPTAPIQGVALALFEPQQRSLSWLKGPNVPLVSGTREYMLRVGSRTHGTPGDHFLEVRVPSDLSTLPMTSISEDLLIFGAPLPDDEIRRYLDEALSDVEESAIQVYLEPTKVITRIPAGAAVFGSTIPSFINADWDKEVDAISHEPPTPGQWIRFEFDHIPLIRIDELHGELANQRILTVPSDWIQVHHEGGYVQLMPYLYTAQWELLALQYGFVLRGAVDLPNWWHFSAVVGFKETPLVLLQLVAKKAAIEILGVAAQASYNAISNKSISKDGTSQSTSFTTSAMYGIYSATILDNKEWIKNNEDRLHQRFHGLQGGALG